MYVCDQAHIVFPFLLFFFFSFFPVILLFLLFIYFAYLFWSTCVCVVCVCVLFFSFLFFSFLFCSVLFCSFVFSMCCANNTLCSSFPPQGNGCKSRLAVERSKYQLPRPSLIHSPHFDLFHPLMYLPREWFPMGTHATQHFLLWNEHFLLPFHVYTLHSLFGPFIHGAPLQVCKYMSA